MEPLYALAGMAAGFIIGIGFACARIRGGSAPSLRSVILRDGGSGEER